MEEDVAFARAAYHLTSKRIGAALFYLAYMAAKQVYVSSNSCPHDR